MIVCVFGGFYCTNIRWLTGAYYKEVNKDELDELCFEYLVVLVQFDWYLLQHKAYVNPFNPIATNNHLMFVLRYIYHIVVLKKNRIGNQLVCKVSWSHFINYLKAYTQLIFTTKTRYTSLTQSHLTTGVQNPPTKKTTQHKNQ